MATRKNYKDFKSNILYAPIDVQWATGHLSRALMKILTAKRYKRKNLEASNTNDVSRLDLCGASGARTRDQRIMSPRL